MELEYRFGNETLVFPIAVAYHRQCGCLHTSERVCTSSGGNGDGLRGVDTHEPVRFTACFGCIIQLVVLRTGFQVFQSLTDGFVGKRTDPEAVKRSGTSDVLVQIAEDKFSLAPCIGGDNNLIAFTEQLGDNFDLRHHAAVGLVAFFSLDLPGDKGKHGGNNRQVVTMESLDTIPFGQGGHDQMPESPCHIIPVTFQVTFLSLRSTYDAGDFPRHAGLFSQNCFHTHFIYCGF